METVLAPSDFLLYDYCVCSWIYSDICFGTLRFFAIKNKTLQSKNGKEKYSLSEYQAYYPFKLDELMISNSSGIMRMQQSTSLVLREGLYNLIFNSVLPHETFFSDYFKVQDALQSKGYVLAAKNNNSFKKENVSYKGVNNVYLDPEGHEFELQFHTQGSYDMKEKINHVFYEEQRRIDVSPNRYVELDEIMIANTNTLKIPENIGII